MVIALLQIQSWAPSRSSVLPQSTPQKLVWFIGTKLWQLSCLICPVSCHRSPPPWYQRRGRRCFRPCKSGAAPPASWTKPRHSTADRQDKTDRRPRHATGNRRVTQQLNTKNRSQYYAHNNIPAMSFLYMDTFSGSFREFPLPGEEPERREPSAAAYV